MKNIIFYFTGTGNSLKIAKDIAEGLGDTKLIRITSSLEISNEPIKCERVGIVTPVYMGNIPLMVKEFLEKLNINKDTYIFTVSTCGGMAGNTHNQIRSIFRKKNLNISAEFSFHFPANNQTRYAPQPLSEQQKLCKSNIFFVTQAIEEIKEFNKIKVNSSLVIKTLSKLISGFLNPRKSDVDFYSDEKCISCGICSKVCPANNIILENGKPIWQHNCERCTACMQLCPKEAIQFKEGSKKWGRYHNPDISIKELII